MSFVRVPKTYFESGIIVDSIKKTNGQSISTSSSTSVFSEREGLSSSTTPQSKKSGYSTSLTSSNEPESTTNKNVQIRKPLRAVPKDERTLADQMKAVSEILKLDKDPVKALQKALRMPNFFKSQK